jgi:hypothetical protein
MQNRGLEKTPKNTCEKHPEKKIRKNLAKKRPLKKLEKII